MDARLIALKLFLEELEVSPEIGTVDDRVFLQKVIYLGQRTGVDLGYRFGWYLRGPYSPALTQDYFSLAEALALGEDDYKQKTFPKSIKDKIAKAKILIQKPDNIELQNCEWLELVASLHFLLNVSHYDEPKAREVIRKEKPHLVDFVDFALEKLNGNPLC